MALWVKAQQLPPESLQQIYGVHFPIEVRHYLAQWIEEKMWTDIDQDNPQYEQYAGEFVRSLVQQLEIKSSSLNSEEMFLAKMKLAEAARHFSQKYSNNPLQLFNYIRHCLLTEMRLVQTSTGDLSGMESLPLAAFGLNTNSVGTEILQELNVLRTRTQESSEELRKMEQEQESFAIQYHQCTKLNAHLQTLATQDANQQTAEMVKKVKFEKERLEENLNHTVTKLLQMRLALVDKLKESIELLGNLQGKVLDGELIRWKREQQLAGNGAPFNSNLDNIQEWCESLAEIIWHNRTQIKEVERLKQKLPLESNMVDMLPSINTQITQLLSSLVTSTFIIEKQPPQVMKTNTRFTSTVRLLVGGKLNVHMTPPQVKVTIISENQANALLKNDKLGVKSGEASGEILNNTGTMEYQQANRQLSVSFRNMQLKKIKRAEKKGTESVMDEKFSLLFQSQFSVGGGELVFQVWTLSLPVVVIVHGNQEPHAWATVTWDNAFAEPGRVPFVVPDKVPWGLVAEALNVKFRAATGRPLTNENLRFLSEKAFRATTHQDLTNTLLSWAQFCKEPLPDRNFTFWEWFYAVMKLTREHLRGPWVDGSILGFVQKKQAEEKLQVCTNGTFLLRFSDSELGGVTIAWVGDGEVFMLQPFTSKDFTIRTLADRLSDLQHLLCLYPDIPKNTAFQKYYTPFLDNNTKSDGYVRPLLITHVPGFGGPGSMMSNTYPNTPQSHYLQSPDPNRDTPSVASSYGGHGNVTGSSGTVINDMDYELSQQLGLDVPIYLQNLTGELDGELQDLIN